MLSSFSASSYAVRNSVIMCGLSALSASGRFSVIVALWPSTSYLMVVKCRDIGIPFLFLSSSAVEIGCALVHGTPPGPL